MDPNDRVARAQDERVAQDIIAATTRTLDAALWTRNIKYFPMIVGLTPPY